MSVKGKRPLGRPKHIWEGNGMYPSEIGCVWIS